MILSIVHSGFGSCSPHSSFDSEVDEDDPCNALKLLGLECCLVGEGSHRRLLTSIRIDTQDGCKDQQLMEACEVIIIERLSADPFELQHLHELRVYIAVTVFGYTNLELPSFISNRSAVEIHMDLAFNKASRLKSSLQIDIEILLHARYLVQALSKNGYLSVQLGECDAFLRCSLKSYSWMNPCLSIFTTGAADKLSNGCLVWEIPSGVKTHAGFVSNFTFLSAALASITIILSSYFVQANDVATLKQLFDLPLLPP